MVFAAIAGILVVSHTLVFVLGMVYKGAILAEKEALKFEAKNFIDKKL